MNRYYIIVFFFSTLGIFEINAQKFSLSSPDNTINLSIENGKKLFYSIRFNNQQVIDTSFLGFEFKNEPSMTGGFRITSNKTKNVDENWTPVIKSRHSKVRDNYNELHLQLKEDTGLLRRMDVEFRVYNDGVTFRYKLFRSQNIGDRLITKELTTFAIPGDPDAWIVEYGGYATCMEGEFKKHKLSYLKDTSIAGLPIVVELNSSCWLALTEANIDNYTAFYAGTDGKANIITTKLNPLPGELAEGGVKVAFDDDIYTPWRVILLGKNPGTFIESEIIQNVNEPCKITDPSWIKPGISAWDNWWSGDVKMEMPVIKQYIDMASTMGWEYMLVDWQWYGEFNTPKADITKCAPQLNMAELIEYANTKNVRIILWLYSSDVNRNSAYKEAFPLYNKWGIAGVKIDFMDRDDQQMVNWYTDIIQCAADNKLLVDFHGAYKPDGIIRTYPNMITREGVMGNEHYKFGTYMSAEHNVKLAFTRMISGQMDYTPGGFLNVTREQFKLQLPTLVSNTRAAELAKFIVYESPLTVVCDHPDNIIGKPGYDFLRIVPTVWDDTRFLEGHPDTYVAIARENEKVWYVGVLNNSEKRTIELSLDFLPEGNYNLEIWADTKNSTRRPVELLKEERIVTNDDKITVNLAVNGGFAGIIKAK